jgi:hypothetical protein
METITTNDEVATAAAVTTNNTASLEVAEYEPDTKYPFHGKSLSKEQLDSALAAINGLKALLPPMPSLTSLERRRMAKLGIKSRGFVDAAFEAAQKDPGVLPGSLSLARVQEQDQFHRYLSLLETHIADFNAKLGDALLLTGNWNYLAALSIYSTFKTPWGKAKMPEQQAFLRQRFARTPKTKEGQPEATAKTK